jgi:hypothetical protein
VVSVNDTTGLASQLSVAVTLAGAGMALQLAFAFEGTPESTGASVSVTVMTWLADDALPHASVAVHVLVRV